MQKREDVDEQRKKCRQNDTSLFITNREVIERVIKPAPRLLFACLKKVSQIKNYGKN
jgi:hypothetical protein